MIINRCSGRVSKWKKENMKKKVPVDGRDNEKYVETERLVQERISGGQP